MDYEIQYARITTAGKLPDRFLNCQSRQSSDLAKVYMGKIYTLVEIISPWFTTSQVGQSVINTFSQVYYGGQSTSDLDNFEEALSKVNENLARITQNGETNWIGNLNAILSVQIENRIILAQTGRVEAYIFREGKINHLTYGLAQTQAEMNPAKTFTNITSGELKQHDKVLIANQELFANLEMDTLREIISMNRPSEAVLQIAKILKKKKARAVNVLIMELMSMDEASKIAVTSGSDNIQLDRPIESLWVGFEKFWISILRPILVFSAKYLKKILIKLVALTKASLRKYQEKRKQAVTPVVNDKFQQEFIKEANGDEGLLKDEEIEYSPELHVHYYEQAEKRSKERKLENTLRSFLKITERIVSWFTFVLKNKKLRPYLMAAVALAILLFLGLFACNHHGESKKGLSLVEAQSILSSAQASQKDAKIASLAGDEGKASNKYYECVTNTQKIMSVDLVKTDAGNLLTSCQSELDLLTNTTRFSQLNPIITAPQAVKAVFVSGGQVVMAGDNDIYMVTTSGGKPEKISTIPRNNGNIEFGSLIDQNLYLYTSARKLYLFNLENKTLDLVQVSGDLETANSVGGFAGNLYFLDGIMGKITKHVANGKDLGPGQDYILGVGNVKSGGSMAIDGSIYVLNNNGTVTRLQKGKILDFELQQMPTIQSKIEKPLKIYTDSDSTFLYILDGELDRVLEFDKDGIFTRQYALPANLQNVTDFAVSAKAKKIWILNENSLYEIGI